MISVPEVKANADIYRVIFQDERVTFRVDRIRDDRHTIKGEVTVMTSYPGLEPHILGPVQVNMVSSSALRTFARDVKANCPSLDPLEWDRMASRMAREVVARYREGEPVISIAEHQTSDSLDMRVDPLLYERRPHLGFGYAGSAKTLISNCISVLVASGLHRAGFTPEPGNVLGLDYEGDPDEAKARNNAVSCGLGIETPRNIFYRFMYQPIASDIERIQRIVLDKDITLVIIDSAAPACGGEPESAEATIKYFSALRSLKVTTLTLAHIPKASSKDPFGSVFWKNLPRAVYKITSTQKPGDSVFNVGIAQTKVNWADVSNPLASRLPSTAMPFALPGPTSSTTLNLRWTCP